MFKEHFDTGHFGKNINVFDRSQTLILSSKLHGTSSRIGHVLVKDDLSWFEQFAKFFKARVKEFSWKYLNGTRRVVIEESSGEQFHDPTIREKAFNLVANNLRKGETVYGEIVGFETNGSPIMPSVDTTKLNDKEFTKKYGKIMTYSYGCTEKESKFYVYRITMTNEDGYSIDYSWDDVVSRCKELGLQTVPHLRTFTLRELELELLLKNNSTADRVDDRDLCIKNFSFR